MSTFEVERAFVYVIEHELGPLKIGVSTNPGQRLKDLQTSCPYELEVRGLIETEQPFGVEKRLHEKFEDSQKRGEWYDLSPEQLETLDMTFEVGDRRLDLLLMDDEERRRRTLTEQGLIG